MKKISSFLLLLTLVSTSYAQTKQNVDKIATLLNIIKFAYVDTINENKLVDNTIADMLEKLDPHSAYIPASDVQEANEPLVANFEGIGIQFNIIHDTIFVISPISGGPSEKLGVSSGDKIVSIDGINVAGIKIKNEDVFKKLRGRKGTSVIVSCLKVGTTKIIDYTIIRDKIPIYSVDASYMINDKIGYVKISRFASTTYDEMMKAFKKLKAEGMQNLIIDLNDNGGGYLEIAIRMADEFLSGDKTIVYTKGAQAPKIVSNAQNRGVFEKGKLVVMIDEGSASASEILSGAIQDWDRGIIVGRRSFGKGLVQKPFLLPDKSEVRLTIARYYTPAGRCVQKNYEEGSDKYFGDLNTRYKKGEFFSADSIKFPDSLKFKTPAGRYVYGGGGIMPDVFVPLDTTGSSSYAFELSRKNIWNQFSLTYVNENKKTLQTKYKTVKDFKSNFIFDDNLKKQLVALAEKEGVKYNDENYNKAKKLIELRIKADLAQKLFNQDAFYEIVNELEPIYNKAVDIMQNADFSKYKIQVD